MSADYKSLPTPVLIERWERLRDGLMCTPPDDRTVGDMDALLGMRSEIERRVGEPKPGVDINFSSDYLTD